MPQPTGSLRAARAAVSAACVYLLFVPFAGCADQPMFFEGTGDGKAYVESDPSGGMIFVDGLQTRVLTPDTVRGLDGRHDIVVRLDSQRVSYRYLAEINIADPEIVPHITGPLLVRCGSTICYEEMFRLRRGAQTRFATNPTGTLFLATGSGAGIVWPDETDNSYASGGMPMFAAFIDGQDTAALGIYDTGYLAGRPAPEMDQQSQSVRLEQSSWILPAAARLPFPTVRGIAVRETVVASSAFPAVILVRLVFRNVSANALYQRVDPYVPVQGVTFERAYIGFALDPDIGNSTDDLFSYDLEQNLVFAYDARFDESGFANGFSRSPGIVGLRALETPPGSEVILNGWMRQGFDGDWSAGLTNERIGWEILSGAMPYPPDHPHPRIGNLPVVSADARIAITAGPLTLAPDDSATIKLAILLAEPVEGTFQPGQLFDPGDPLDPDRPMRAVIDSLVALGMRAADVPIDPPAGGAGTVAQQRRGASSRR